VKPPNDTVIASLVTIDASAPIGFGALGNAFTIDNAGAGNVVDVVDTTFATAVVVADDDTFVDGESTVGLVVVAVVVVAVVVGAIVVGVVVVGAEPALGASTSAASRINHAAAELGAIMPDAALLVPTATH
jgi:hypothetical protein